MKDDSKAQKRNKSAVRMFMRRSSRRRIDQQDLVKGVSYAFEIETRRIIIVFDGLRRIFSPLSKKIRIIETRSTNTIR
jgi:hypothetical protein